MGLGIFRRSFTVRRFGEDAIVGGYAVSTYADTVTTLDVQPLSHEELQALPEGERATKRMKAFGDMVLTAADEETGRRGDWLYYRGKMDPEGHWYQCVSSIGWDHTLLGHCRSEFVQVSAAEAARYGPPDASKVGWLSDRLRGQKRDPQDHPDLFCRCGGAVCQAELCP